MCPGYIGTSSRVLACPLGALYLAPWKGHFNPGRSQNFRHSPWPGPALEGQSKRVGDVKGMLISGSEEEN